MMRRSMFRRSIQPPVMVPARSRKARLMMNCSELYLIYLALGQTTCKHKLRTWSLKTYPFCLRSSDSERFSVNSVSMTNGEGADDNMVTNAADSSTVPEPDSSSDAGYDISISSECGRSQSFCFLWKSAFEACKTLDDLNEVFDRCSSHWREKTASKSSKRDHPRPCVRPHKTADGAEAGATNLTENDMEWWSKPSVATLQPISKKIRSSGPNAVYSGSVGDSDRYIEVTFGRPLPDQALIC